MKNDLITVIVPVYNTNSELFKKCMDSIYHQTYKNIEILVIDDGSKEEYRDIYNSDLIDRNYNIRIIKKDNSGVSDTRNMGIHAAKGKYVMFIDSDDYVSYDYIETMYKAIIKNNVKISISGASIVSEDDKLLGNQLCPIVKNKKIELNEYINEFIYYPYFTCVKMLIERKIIKKEFNKNIKYGEDLLFAFELIKENPIVYLDNCNYFYVQNENSVIHHYSKEKMIKYLEDNLYVFNYIKKYYTGKNRIIEIRLFTKFEIALDRLIRSKNCSYKDFKNVYYEYRQRFLVTQSIKKEEIFYIKKINRFKCIILYKKLLFVYYVLCKLKRIVR